LLDADACICAHECGGWAVLRERYEIVVGETVVNEVKYYLDRDLNKHLLGLESEVEEGLITQCSATPDEQTRFMAKLHPTVREKLDPGEIEILAYFVHHTSRDMALVTGDGAAITAGHALGFSEQMLSLEAAYQRIGHTKKLRVDMTERKFQEQLRRASILVAQGRALL
jgi:hypothetical protein